MYNVRESWTDERMDDFAKRVDQRFDGVDKRFDKVEHELHDLRSEMNARFDSLQRTMFQTSVLVIVALIGLIATQL